MNDFIRGDIGDGGQSNAIGKGINQTDRSNRVNVYHNEPHEESIEDRLERLETYVYGNPRYDEPGIIRRQRRTDRILFGLSALNVLAILASFYFG